MEEDLVKRQVLKLHAKVEGKYAWNQHKPHNDECGPRDFEKHMFKCASMCLTHNNNTVQIILEEDVVKRQVLKRYANVKGKHKHMESKNHITTSVVPGILKKRCLSACRCAFKRNNIKSKSYWRRI